MADEISIRIALRNAAKFARDVRQARRELDGLDKNTKKAGLSAKFTGKQYGIFANVMRTLSIVGAVGAIGALAQVTVASGVAAVGLLATLVPLVGVLGALPALGLLAGQGLGVVALAFNGIKQATGGLNSAIDAKKFAALTRPGQNFVLLLDALKPRVRAFQASLQRGLFPGLTEGLKAALPALDALKRPLTGTARIIGDFGARLGHLVGSRGFLADLHSQATFNNVQFRRLSGAGLHLVNVFRNLMVGSRGLVSWIVRMVSGWAKSADTMTAAGRAGGGLQRGFHTVQVTLSRVGRLFWALGVSLFNIGRIGKQQIGDGILVYLLRAALALERWTKSDAGIDRITRAFSRSRAILHDVAEWIRSLRESAGPGLSTALHNIVAAFVTLLSSGGSGAILSLYVSGLSDLAAVITWLGTNVPGASQVMSAFLALFLLNKVTGVLKMGVAFTKLGASILIAASGTRIGATALWALNAAMVTGGEAAAAMWAAITGPVGLVVIAIAAVVAIAVLLYNKWAWFHRAVDNTWDFITKHWPLLLTILTGPIGLAVAIISGKFDSLKHDVGAVLDWIAKKAKGVLGLPGKALGFLGSLPGKLVGGLLGHHATGGIVDSPLQVIGERGPELAALPVGSRVFTHSQTQAMLAPKVSSLLRASSPAAQAPLVRLASPSAVASVRMPEPTATRIVLRAPTVAPVHRSEITGRGDGADDRPIHLHSTTTLQVSGRVLAKVVNDEVARQDGRDR